MEMGELQGHGSQQDCGPTAAGRDVHRPLPSAEDSGQAGAAF